MRCTTIPIYQDTTISRIFPNRNFSNSRGLFLASDMGNSLSRILLKFPIKLNSLIGSEDIISAKLYLQVREMNGELMDIALYRNIENFNYRYVDFNTMPNAMEVYDDFNIIRTPRGLCLEVDITELIRQWTDVGGANYGLQLEAIGENLRMIFASSRTQCAPYVKVVFRDGHKPGSKSGLRGMQLQCQYANNEVIEDNNPVVFDTILYQDEGFLYNQATGEITVIRPGRYYVSWSVSSEGAEDVESISFALQNTDNSINVKASIQNPMSGMISGTAFFNVTSGPQVFTVNNVSYGKVQLLYDEGSVQANLVIVRVD